MNERVQIDRARALRIGDVAEARAAMTSEQIRAEFCARFPAEFEHGYRFGVTGEFQAQCDAAGYPIGLHTWPLDRRNAWWAGFNAGHAEKEKASAKKVVEQSPLAADRERWRKYRAWEDKHFPLSEAPPFRDPPGMAAARRKFEAWAKEMRLRDISRGAAK